MQHSTIFSGILSVVTCILIFVASIYYALEFINRNSPKAYFFNRYIEDAGNFPLNASSMFNFIQIADKRTNEAIPFDFSAFRVVGFDDVFYDEYMKEPNIIKEKDHWTYGYCNNDTDTKGISYLVNFNYYQQSACIRAFYDHNKKQYFDTGEEGFRWPILEKGCSHPQRTYYGLIIQRCDESPDILKSKGPECKSKDEITQVLSKISLRYQIIDHYPDILNYEMPFTKYFYEVTSAITNGIYIINHLNFNPANMLTHNGLFFENQIQERTYFFTQNEKHTVDQSILTDNQSTNGCLIGIYFWMQNTLQYYERNYDRIQDVLSNIGGISKVFLTVASIINLLIHNFILLSDTEELVINKEKDNFVGRNFVKKPTIFKRPNEIMYPPRRIYRTKNNSNNNMEISSNYQRLMKNGVTIFQKINIKDENPEQNLNLYYKGNNMNKNDKEYSQNTIYKSPSIVVDKNREYFRKKNNDYNMRNYSRYNDIINLKKIDTGEKDNSKRKTFNWPQYIKYLICSSRNDKAISFYENIRAKLISEENIIQNYLDLYELLKLNNIRKENILEK